MASEDMEIWLKCEGEDMQIPLLPPSFSVGLTNGHQRINVQTKGERTILGKKGLNSFEFTSFFPGQDYSVAAYPKDRNPADYIKQIKGWVEKPVHLTVTKTKINWDCTIESFTYGAPDGSGDIEYTLSLMEYKPPTYTAPKKPPVANKPIKLPEKTTPPRPVKTPPKTYTVKSGDCLWNIAKSFYGSGSKESVIYNANKAVIEAAAKKHGYTSSYNKGLPGWWIFPGTKLVIP